MQYSLTTAMNNTGMKQLVNLKEMSSWSISIIVFIENKKTEKVWPTGPIRSSSRDVYIFIYLSVPFSCQLFKVLSLALRSHDQFEASH